MPNTTSNTQEESSRLKSLATLVPVIVGVCSLLFAGWQYVEKRGADRELAALQVKEQQYKNIVAKAKNAARLDECYLEVTGTLLYGRLLHRTKGQVGFGDEVLQIPPPGKIGEGRLNAALVAVTDDLRRSLQWAGDLKLARTPIVDDIMMMLENGEGIDSMRFLVLRNAGLYDLGDVQVDTSLVSRVWNGASNDWDCRYEPYHIQTGAVAPGSAVAVCIGVQPTFVDVSETIGASIRPRELVPQQDEAHRSQVTFTDELTNHRASRLIRDEYRDTSLIISAYIQVGG